MVLHRFLVRCISASPSRPAMNSGGPASLLPVSHRSTGAFGDPKQRSVQNDGGDSPPPFWASGCEISGVHRRFVRRWTPGEVGARPCRIATHHRGIRRSGETKRAEWGRTLSSLILHRSYPRRTRPSPSRPAMDEPRGKHFPSDFGSRRGGKERSTEHDGAEPRGRLFPVVLCRYLTRCGRSRNSPHGHGPPLGS